jgi:hypothetical protein
MLVPLRCGSGKHLTATSEENTMAEESKIRLTETVTGAG